MSNEKKKSLIKDLKPYKDEWRLTVKLLHSWKQSTSFGGDTLECVLVDESGDKIQASCKKSLMWKVIDTFKIGGAGGQYRPTKQQYKMTILTDTMISRSDYLNDSEFLDLASYEDIFNGTCKPNFLIDFMGQVTDLAAVATVQVKGIDTKRVNFRLRDESGNEVACCLWGKYAEQFEKHMEETTPDICLIRFAKIKEYRGEIQITNAFDVSLLFLNPTMKEAVEFKKFPRTAKSSAQLNPVTRIGVGFILDVIDTTAIEDLELLPMPLQDLVGKSFCFGVKVTSENFSNGSDIFKVSEVWSGDYIQRIESLSEPLSLNETISSTMSGGEIPAMELSNENSYDGFATPNVKRKDDDLDQQEMTSTSKKLCRTIVKKEKIGK
ncbi:hypothetical protein Bca52824_027256 [Brassica carinata]|uniref:DUF223 domain-containing protein n=1 Tax=Brassica carinata TaxID=52824 RepID=A0A8X7SI46_BRACI|nr:hypothetical protein Bca52824_027256 [Brassica carinata]